MKNKETSKRKRFLIYGMIGAIFAAIGDFLLLGVDTTGASGSMGQYFMAASQISYTRIGLAGFFGFVGIPVSAFGFYVLYLLMDDKDSVLARLYRASVYGYIALGGAIHIICCYLVTGMKKDMETGTAAENILQAVLTEQGGYLIPSCVVFFTFYFIHIITMLIIVVRKRTILPGWMWILNPLTFKILFNAIAKLGTSAFLNGLGCANMSLGGLIIMVAWLIVIMRKCE